MEPNLAYRTCGWWRATYLIHILLIYSSVLDRKSKQRWRVRFISHFCTWMITRLYVSPCMCRVSRTFSGYNSTVHSLCQHHTHGLFCLFSHRYEHWLFSFFIITCWRHTTKILLSRSLMFTVSPNSLDNVAQRFSFETSSSSHHLFLCCTVLDIL